MNIIFLDIDGVFLTYRPEKYFDYLVYGCNWDVFKTFLKILQNTKIPTKIVMISTTMLLEEPFKKFEEYPELNKQLQDLLYPKHCALESCYITGHNRALGISKWLHLYGQDVEKFVIIDDSYNEYLEHEELYTLKQKFHLIPCRTMYGMQWLELRLLDLFLRDNISKVDKKFINKYLEFGFMSNEKLEKCWNKYIRQDVN